MRHRLAPEERRRRIVDAAVPLFARKGFSGTTTKEIAEAAGVSEGLVFKYFTSKTALYEAILDHCQTANPEFARLAKLPPSTATLVEMVFFLTGYFVGMKKRPETQVGRHLLFMRSLLDDGEFAAAGMQAFGDIVKPVLGPCLAAAAKSGDLTGEITTDTAFKLMAQVQIMIGTFALPDRAKFADTHDETTITRDAARFILRGLGVRAAVVDALSDHFGHGLQYSEQLRKTA